MISQNLDGEIRDIWRPLTVGICDLAVAPDGTCLVAVGVEQKPETTSTTSEPGFEQSQNPTPTSDETAVLIRPSPYFKNWEVLIFDLAAQEMEACVLIYCFPRIWQYFGLATCASHRAVVTSNVSHFILIDILFIDPCR